MQWMVKLKDKSIVVGAPDVLVDQQSFTLRIDGQDSTALWHKATATLVLTDERGLERMIRLRSSSIERFEGESQMRVSAELLATTLVGMQYPTLTVEAHVPGIERKGGAKAQAGLVVRSQITGKVLKVLVKTGDAVAPGDTLLLVEAMKMENRVFATVPGVVAAVAVKDGDAIATGKELLRLEPPKAAEPA